MPIVDKVMQSKALKLWLKNDKPNKPKSKSKKLTEALVSWIMGEDEEDA